MNRWVLAAAAVLFVAFAVFVWPTPYKYILSSNPSVVAIRVNRFTGITSWLTIDGWEALGPAKTALPAGFEPDPPAGSPSGVIPDSDPTAFHGPPGTEPYTATPPVPQGAEPSRSRQSLLSSEAALTDSVSLALFAGDNLKAGRCARELRAVKARLRASSQR